MKFQKQYSPPRLMILVGYLIVGISKAETTQATIVPTKHIQPFLEKHCINCHGPEKQKGQLRFDDISWSISTNDKAQHWQDILDVLNANEMPPEEKPQPEKEELLEVLNTLTKTLNTARKRLTASGGEITMRHLNRREYVNSIRDLFGIHISENALPEDAESENFDTAGSAQYFSSVNFERYYDLGTKIAREGLNWSGKPYQEPSKVTRYPGQHGNKRLKSSIADAQKKKQQLEAGVHWKKVGFKDEVDKRLFLDRYEGRYGLSEKYLDRLKGREGSYIFNGLRGTDDATIHLDKADPRAAYRLKIYAGTVAGTPEARHYLYTRTRSHSEHKVMKVTGTEQNLGTLEFLTTPKLLSDDKRNAVTFYEASPFLTYDRKFKNYQRQIGDKTDFASIYIDRVDVEGPFYPKKSNFFGNLISKEGKDLAGPDNARELIKKFAYEAFRRQTPETAYINELVDYFEQNIEAGDRYEEAMSKTLGVVLTSPNFLYIQESPTSNSITAREFVIRLSYFLWSSPPDEELYQLAESGTLHSEVLKEQVVRMLADRKAESFFKGFMDQWAEIDRFHAISVDPQEYFHYNKGVQASATQEVYEFFKVLVKENLPVENIIDSDFVVINQHLGHYYGIAGAQSDDFQKVPLPQKTKRGGFLTQTAFLTMGSNGERSSPVIRGTMVLDKILNDPPPPPPPNVPELGLNVKEPLSNREMVKLHQSQTQCSSCHSRIDPIGFGMENFDAIGRFRTREKIGKSELDIEAGGTLVSGITFNGIDELKTLLKTQRHRLAREFIESMASYGIGRDMEFSDDTAIHELTVKCLDDDFRLQAMIYRIISSPLFRSK
ncbi:DUF1592 domain-containing protein [Rubritalea spongiae]|uniref:DUF1592 domain-containing protein n=1 Tax=Rubritalea spongiae TaxID=430797 RepID=A0ABW5E1E2_9BACT